MSLARGIAHVASHSVSTQSVTTVATMRRKLVRGLKIASRTTAKARIPSWKPQKSAFLILALMGQRPRNKTNRKGTRAEGPLYHLKRMSSRPRPAPRFSGKMGGNVAPDVIPLQGYLVIPVRNALIWIVMATIVGTIIGGITLWFRRRSTAQAA